MASATAGGSATSPGGNAAYTDGGSLKVLAATADKIHEVHTRPGVAEVYREAAGEIEKTNGRAYSRCIDECFEFEGSVANMFDVRLEKQAFG